MTKPNINNLFRVAGRLVRDPNYARKEGETTACFFRVAAQRSFVNKDGDVQTVADYIEVRVFDPKTISDLEAKGLNKGAKVVATGRATCEIDQYTNKDGQEVTRAVQQATVERDVDGYCVTIEALGGHGDDETGNGEGDIPT